jgi:hypothetical protein
MVSRPEPPPFLRRWKKLQEQPQKYCRCGRFVRSWRKRQAQNLPTMICWECRRKAGRQRAEYARRVHPRYCAWCPKQLRRDNKTGLCAHCQRHVNPRLRHIVREATTTRRIPVPRLPAALRLRFRQLRPPRRWHLNLPFGYLERLQVVAKAKGIKPPEAGREAIHAYLGRWEALVKLVAASNAAKNP